LFDEVSVSFLWWEKFEKKMSTPSTFDDSLRRSNETPLKIVIIGFGVVGKGVLVGLQKHFRDVQGIVLDAK
jgi:S-adenosylhomocysteine hydrolase